MLSGRWIRGSEEAVCGTISHAIIAERALPQTFPQPPCATTVNISNFKLASSEDYKDVMLRYFTSTNRKFGKSAVLFASFLDQLRHTPRA